MRSHNFVSSGSLLASLIRVLRIHDFCQNRCCSRCSLRSKLAGTLFLTFFSKVFRTSLCKDFICNCAQKGHLLQRRKSVCTYTLHDSRESIGSRKDFIEDLCENMQKTCFFLSCRKDFIDFFFFGENVFAPKKNKPMKSLRQL